MLFKSSVLARFDRRFIFFVFSIFQLWIILLFKKVVPIIINLKEQQKTDWITAYYLSGILDPHDRQKIFKVIVHQD